MRVSSAATSAAPRPLTVTNTTALNLKPCCSAFRCSVNRSTPPETIRRMRLATVASATPTFRATALFVDRG